MKIGTFEGKYFHNEKLIIYFKKDVTFTGGNQINVILDINLNKCNKGITIGLLKK